MQQHLQSFQSQFNTLSQSVGSENLWHKTTIITAGYFLPSVVWMSKKKHVDLAVPVSHLDVLHEWLTCPWPHFSTSRTPEVTKVNILLFSASCFFLWRRRLWCKLMAANLVSDNKKQTKKSLCWLCSNMIYACDAWCAMYCLANSIAICGGDVSYCDPCVECVISPNTWQ